MPDHNSIVAPGNQPILSINNASFLLKSSPVLYQLSLDLWPSQRCLINTGSHPLNKKVLDLVAGDSQLESGILRRYTLHSWILGSLRVFNKGLSIEENLDFLFSIYNKSLPISTLRSICHWSELDNVDSSQSISKFDNVVLTKLSISAAIHLNLDFYLINPSIICPVLSILPSFSVLHRQLLKKVFTKSFLAIPSRNYDITQYINCEVSHSSFNSLILAPARF